MDGRSCRSSYRTARVIAAGLILALSGSPSEAAPIHSHALATATGPVEQPGLGPAWARFLAGGAALWAESKPPRIPAHLHLLSQNGQLVESPFVDYLFWRRSLNPIRFDHYHPSLGPALGNLIPPTTPIPIPTPIPTPTPTPNPQPQVPEPASVMIALILAGAALWQRRRSSQTG